MPRRGCRHACIHSEELEVTRQLEKLFCILTGISTQAATVVYYYISTDISASHIF